MNDKGINIAIVVVVLLFSAFFTWAVSNDMYDKDGNRKCSTYENTPIKDVPLRCARELKLNA